VIVYYKIITFLISGDYYGYNLAAALLKTGSGMTKTGRCKQTGKEIKKPVNKNKSIIDRLFYFGAFI